MGGLMRIYAGSSFGGVQAGGYLCCGSCWRAAADFGVAIECVGFARMTSSVQRKHLKHLESRCCLQPCYNLGRLVTMMHCIRLQSLGL